MEHNHNHGASNIKIAFILNFGFAIIEIIGGIFTNSTAILSDAVHDLGDSLALAFSFFVEKFSKKESSEQYNYGYKRLSLIGALVNIIVLSLGTSYVLKEAIQALMNPQEVHSQGMFLLAIVGIVMNGFAALRMKGSKKILDRTVVLHLLEDLLGWAAVLVVSVVIFFTNWYILDPILSILIALVVIRNIWMNAVQAYSIIMQAVPDKAIYDELKNELKAIEGVNNVDSFKMWSLDGDEHVITVSLSSEKSGDYDEIRRKTKTLFLTHHISQSTVEIIGVV